jgi:hypothetical protein
MTLIGSYVDHLPVDPEEVRAALPDPDPPRPENGSGRQAQWAGQPDGLALIAPLCS